MKEQGKLSVAGMTIAKTAPIRTEGVVEVKKVALCKYKICAMGFEQTLVLEL